MPLGPVSQRLDTKWHYGKRYGTSLNGTRVSISTSLNTVPDSAITGLILSQTVPDRAIQGHMGLIILLRQ